MGLILDTNFVISAERDARKRETGRTTRFFELHREEEFYLTFTVAGELACGKSAAGREAWQKLLRPYGMLGWDREISFVYGELFRKLASRGQLIGTNHLWIASTALRHGMGIVTKNHSEFSRVDGLHVLDY
ncbi:MAG: hypothetical protein Fur0032_22050 [Terrimicrobiaceae bacterium]